MKPVIGHHCKEHQSFSYSFKNCDTVLNVNKTECNDLQITEFHDNKSNC